MPHIAIPEDGWEPPDELLGRIDKKNKLLQRDRVELVIAFYALDHGGNSPTYEEIGAVLNIPRANAHRFAMELTRPWERRAIKRDGKIWLVQSDYSHPVLKEPRFAKVMRATEPQM
jgi:hypothetical protein